MILTRCACNASASTDKQPSIKIHLQIARLGVRFLGVEPHSDDDDRQSLAEEAEQFEQKKRFSYPLSCQKANEGEPHDT